jgi:hypothetical protein
MASTAFNVPHELSLRAFAYLEGSHGDLASCARVCRQFNQLAVPLLYNTIPLDTLPIGRVISLNRTLKANDGLLAYIRKINIDIKQRSKRGVINDQAWSWAPFEEFASLLPRMTELLELRTRDFSPHDYDGIVLRVLGKVACCEAPFAIKLLHTTPYQTLKVLFEDDAVLRRVTHLHIDDIRPEKVSMVEKILKGAPKLEYVHLHLRDESGCPLLSPGTLPSSIKRLAVAGGQEPSWLPQGIQELGLSGGIALSTSTWELAFGTKTLEHVDIFLDPASEESEWVWTDEDDLIEVRKPPPQPLALPEICTRLRILKLWSQYDGFMQGSATLQEAVEHKRYFPEGLLGKVFESNPGLEDVLVDALSLSDLRTLFASCSRLQALRWLFIRAPWIDESDTITECSLLEALRGNPPRSLRTLMLPCASGLLFSSRSATILQFCPRLEEWRYFITSVDASKGTRRLLGQASADGDRDENRWLVEACAEGGDAAEEWNRLFYRQCIRREKGVPLRGFPMEEPTVACSEWLGYLNTYRVDVEGARDLLGSEVYASQRAQPCGGGGLARLE